MGRELNLGRGRELLAMRSGSGSLGDVSADPRRRTTVVIGDRRIGARYSGDGPIVRLLLDEPITLSRMPGCEINGEALQFLICLDSLDRSRRTYLTRKLADLPTDDPEALRDALTTMLSGSRPQEAKMPLRLSPAARRLLDEFDSSEETNSALQLHLTPLRKRGLDPIVEELAGVGAVLTLENGHVIGADAYRRRVESIRSFEDGFTSQDAAVRWGCSHGRARAILGQIVRDGRVLRREGVFSWAAEDV